MGINSTLLRGATQSIRHAIDALRQMVSSQADIPLGDVDYDLGKAIDRLERIVGELEARDTDE